MTTWTPNTAECLVYTFKEGLLSRVAHDLQLRVGDFEVRREGDQVEAWFDTASITVDHAMRAGRPDEQALSDSDKRKIGKTLRGDVLKSRRHARVRFTGTATGEGPMSLTGELEVVGRRRRVQLTAQPAAQGVELRHRLHQPDYGVKPYVAMMGALKVKPHVEVVLRLR